MLEFAGGACLTRLCLKTCGSLSDEMRTGRKIKRRRWDGGRRSAVAGSGDTLDLSEISLKARLLSHWLSVCLDLLYIHLHLLLAAWNRTEDKLNLSPSASRSLCWLRWSLSEKGLSLAEFIFYRPWPHFSLSTALCFRVSRVQIEIWLPFHLQKQRKKKHCVASFGDNYIF